jgi:hypothetical protein
MHHKRLLLLVIHFACASALHAQSGCLPADSTALQVRGFARRFVSNPDPSYVTLRAGGIFRATDTTKVVVLTTAATCARLVEGYNTKFGTPGAIRRLYLIDVNKTGFFIYEPRVLPPNLLTHSVIYSMTRRFVLSVGYAAM